jgi:RNA polymerase sigma factor (sigma-70 family)
MHEQETYLDVEAIYAATAPRVAALVARNITADASVIEEACQMAWSRLLDHRDQVTPASALGWLTTTAMREALRAVRVQARNVSLDVRDSEGQVVAFPARAPGPERLIEMREQLAEIHQLSERQQRMLWMQGFGYGYEEIAGRTGDSRRTVERQLLRAKRNLRPVS